MDRVRRGSDEARGAERKNNFVYQKINDKEIFNCSKQRILYKFLTQRYINHFTQDF